MPYLNLKAEMAKRDITIEAIAKVLNIHRNSAANKVHGRSAFSIEEASIVQKEFFPNLTLKYLFERS